MSGVTDKIGADKSDLRGYMLAQFAFFTAASMMGLLYPWIYTQYLHLPADQVGFAQSISQIPLLLVLFGGAAADGRALSSYLARLQLVFTAPAIILIAAAAMHGLVFWVAVGCAFAASVISAFIMPARDALLTHAVPKGGALTIAVAAVTSAMFAGQMTGFGIGSIASYTGLVPLLTVHVFVLVVAAMMTSRMALGDVGHAPRARRSLGVVLNDIRDGLRVTLSDTRMRTVTLAIAFGGIAMNGGFVVGLPLMVRDIYHGGSFEVAALFIAFMVGTTITSVILSRARPIEAQGRVFMTFFLNSALMFLGLHFGPPFWGAVLLVFGWGLGAGVGMVLSRSIIQAAAPAIFRARVLSVFQLAQTIGSLIGPIIVGTLIHRFGVLDALLFVPLWVTLLWATISLTTPVWGFRRMEDNAGEADAPALPPSP